MNNYEKSCAVILPDGKFYGCMSAQLAVLEEIVENGKAHPNLAEGALTALKLYDGALEMGTSRFRWLPKREVKSVLYRAFIHPDATYKALYRVQIDTWAGAGIGWMPFATLGRPLELPVAIKEADYHTETIAAKRGDQVYEYAGTSIEF